MKKIHLLLLPLLIALGATTTLAITGQRFTDEANFDDWYKSAAERMYDIEVVKGFPDGSFSGEQDVKRAELVVMLDRFEQHMNQQINEKNQAYSRGITYRALSAYEYLNDLEDEEGKAFDLKPEIAMAESNLNRLDGAPEVNDEFYTFSKMENYTLPAGYTAYREGSKESREGVFPTTIYLNYIGERFGGDDIPHNADEWYGPFYKQNFGVYK